MRADRCYCLYVPHFNCLYVPHFNCLSRYQALPVEEQERLDAERGTRY